VTAYQESYMNVAVESGSETETTGVSLNETLGIAGAGTIACGLAAVAAQHGEVLLWARSERSADRARKTVAKTCAKLDESLDPEQVKIVTDLDALRAVTYVVEAVVEEHGPKADLLSELAGHENESAILATTTSSLSIEQLALANGRPAKFVGLHVFNPVPRMELVELVFPDEATAETRGRSRALFLALGKTPL
jgi:3-hydroxybutyryl-CoA dehydrogenase